MKRSYLLALLLSLFSTSTVLAGAFDDFNIYFVNGINNERGDADKSRRILRQLALPDAPVANVDKLYNTTEGVLSDLLETYRLGAIDKNYKNFWQWLDKPSAAPEWFQKIYYPTLAKYNETLYTQDPDLSTMLTKLKTKAQFRKKTILVAHSEGNFYANMIANNLRSTDPGLATCMGIVAVASPATYVSGAGPYTTLSNDSVINYARTWFPWGSQILPSSPSEPVYNIKKDEFGRLFVPDESGHQFVPSYLEPLNSRIRNHVVDVANQISAKPECAPSSPPCGTPIDSGGSTGTYDYVQTIGSGTQTVTANFEAYRIPDQLEIFAGGTKLASTDGLVSGFKQLSFTFDSAQLGTTQLTARVTGNSDSNTLWKLCVACSSGTSCSWVPQRRAVNISMSYQWTSQWFCTAGNVSVDGSSLGNLSSGSSINTTLTAGAESHLLSAPSAGCICTKTLGCSTNPDAKYTISYKDGTGKTRLISAPLAKQLGFIIN